MTQLTAVVAFACALALSTVTADARPKQARTAPQESLQCVYDNLGRTVCGGSAQALQRHARVSADHDVTIIGGRPAGCPHRYCGCGLARYLGLNDSRLNLAWNWARLFPKAHAGPGMAVVWRSHVALIVSMTGDGEALLRDYNSGGGLSRIHVRSIRGAVIVNPSRQVASND